MQSRNRSGFALPIAIGGIVIIGTLITGVFYTATQENHLGRNTMTQEKAFRAAEGSLNYAYGTFDNFAMNKLANGAVVTQVFDSSAVGWVDTVRTTRLNRTTYWMVSTSYAGTSSANRSKVQPLHRSKRA